MNRHAADQLRYALHAGDLTADQVVELLLETIAPNRTTIPVRAEDLSRIASELRAAASSIGRAASLVERIRAGQETSNKRRPGEELQRERVLQAKAALPTWRVWTPSGPEIAAALNLRSDGLISDIRKRLDADRLALANGGAS
jgi:hypothetical protein